MEKRARLFRNIPGATLNPIKGLYTALAIFLPLIVLTVLGRSPLGVLVMLGALVTAFGDIPAPLRIRVRVLGITCVGGAFMTGLGRVIGGPEWLQITELFLVTLLSGLIAVYGEAASAIGLLLAVPLVLSLARGGGPATALPAAGSFLLGGTILLLFALVCAPLQRFHVTPPSRDRPGLSRSMSAPLTGQLTLFSPLVRFSVLRALGAAATVGLGWLLGGPYPYWAAITVLTCARPDQQTSLELALQSIAATFLGALLAAIVIASVQDLLLLGLIIVAATFLAFTVKDLNYTLYFFFFTNLLLLLLSIRASGHSFALWRIFAILLGSGIVLLIAFLNQVLSPLFANRTSAT